MRPRSQRLMQNALILPILITFLISGCATTSPLEVFTKEVERMPLDLQLPPVETLEQVNLIIVTSDNQEEVFAKMKEQGKDPVLFGLSDEDYELLSKNFAQIRAYMIQQGMTLDQYRKYYEPVDKAKSE